MISFFAKLVAIIESLIAVIIPIAVNTPAPIAPVASESYVEVVSTPVNSPTPSVSPGLVLSATSTPLVEPEISLTPTPTVSVTPTPTPTPDIQGLLNEIKELKQEIINYTPEPTPTPEVKVVIVHVTPIPTPVPTPIPTPVPTLDTQDPLVRISWAVNGGIIYYPNTDEAKRIGGDIVLGCRMCILISSDELVDISLNYITVKIGSEDFYKVKPSHYSTEAVLELAKTKEKTGVVNYELFGSGKFQGKLVLDHHYYIFDIPDLEPETLLFYKVRAIDKAGNETKWEALGYGGDYRIYIQ